MAKLNFKVFDGSRWLAERLRSIFTDRMKSRLNLDNTRANVLEIVDDQLTGKVVGTIVNAD